MENKTVETNDAVKEGWGYVTGRVAHYYVDSMSLCRRRGFYMSDVFPDDGNIARNECKECRRRLTTRQGKTVNAK